MNLIASLEEALGPGYPYDTWSEQSSLYALWRYYYSGDVFTERSVPEYPESPLRYPLKFNEVESFCDKHAAFLWGQWEKDIVSFLVEPVGEDAQELQDRLMRTWRRNRMNSKLERAAIDQKIDGGVYLKVRWDNSEEAVAVDAVRADLVFPLWHPQDVERLLEVAVAYEIPLTAAVRDYNFTPRPLPMGRDIFGRLIGGEPEYPTTVVFIEHWTPTTFKIQIDDQVIRDGENPYGFVPWAYVPHKRTSGSFYGHSVAQAVMGLQDERNMRAADIGERLNYTSHPIRWVRDYNGNLDDLLYEPDTVWDLGQTRGQVTPEVGTLEGSGEPDSSLKFLDLLGKIEEDVGDAPAIAFGRDEGSQRSGQTLEIRFLHLLQAVRRSRVLWSDAFNEINPMILSIEDSQGEYALERLRELKRQYVFSTDFAPPLPRDRRSLVDENIALVGANLKDPEAAMKDLGDPNPAETLAKVKAWVEWLQENQISVQKSFSARRVEGG